MQIKKSQAFQNAKTLQALVVYAPAFLILVVAYFQPAVKMTELTRDAVTVANGMFYFGLISNIGVLMWAATVTACLLSAGLLRSWKLYSYTAFFRYAGLLTAVLLLDDFFMLHSEVLPRLGINENITLLAYPLLILLFLFCFSNKIQATNYLALYTSLIFLAASVTANLLSLNLPAEIIYLLEDGFKFLGISGWFYYFVSTCLAIIKHSITIRFYPVDAVEELLEARA